MDSAVGIKCFDFIFDVIKFGLVHPLHSEGFRKFTIFLGDVDALVGEPLIPFVVIPVTVEANGAFRGLADLFSSSADC